MNFVCDNCQRKYSIPDEKVRERAVRIRCKACQHVMTVGPLSEPEPEPEPEPAPAASQEDSTRMVSFDDLERLKAQAKQAPGKPAAKAAPKPAASPKAGASPWDDEATKAAPPGEAGALWFVSVSGKQVGPYSASEVAQKASAGEILARNFMWKKGMTDWKRAVDLPELSGLFASTPPSSHKKTAAPPPVAHAPEPEPEPPTRAVMAPFDPALGGEELPATDTEAPLGGAVDLAVDDFGPADEVAAAPGESGDDLGGDDATAPGNMGSPLSPPPARRPTAELDAGSLFSDLELSKITRMPQPTLHDLEKMAARDAEAQARATQDVDNFFAGESDVPAAPAPISSAPRGATPVRGTVAMTAGQPRSIFKPILAFLLLAVVLAGGGVVLVHLRLVPAPSLLQDRIDAVWPGGAIPRAEAPVVIPVGSPAEPPVAPAAAPPPAPPPAPATAQPPAPPDKPAEATAPATGG